MLQDHPTHVIKHLFMHLEANCFSQYFTSYDEYNFFFFSKLSFFEFMRSWYEHEFSKTINELTGNVNGKFCFKENWTLQQFQNGRSSKN